MGAGGAQIASRMLACRELVVVRGDIPVLRGLDLEVRAGSLTTLVGPSGAGKTTLLRAVLGLEPVRSGTISIGERNLDGVSTHRRGIGMVFQEPRLFPNLSVADNVAFPLRVAGVSRASRLERGRLLLEDLGLAGFSERRTDSLSGGEQQRVALARALCGEPEILLLDEPLASVDPNLRADLRRLVKELHFGRGLTTLYVTHDLQEAAELGDDIALMLDRRIEQHGPARELFARPSSERAARFLGAVNVVPVRVVAGTAHGEGFSFDATGPDGDAVFVIRPEHVRLTGDDGLRAQVEEAVYMGTHVRVRLRRTNLVLTAHVPAQRPIALGAEVGVELPKEHLWRLPETSSRSSRGPG